MSLPESPWKSLALVSIIATHLVILLLIGVWVGNRVDAFFQTSPWFMVLGLFIGLGAGVLGIIPIIKKFLGGK